jgi:hypothetical protein
VLLLNECSLLSRKCRWNVRGKIWIQNSAAHASCKLCTLNFEKTGGYENEPRGNELRELEVDGNG